MGNNINNQVKKAFNTVVSGGVILYPTETVWGLGCDATNCKAIKKLNSIKKRNSENPMLSLVSDISMISNYIENLPDNLNQIISELKEPSTILYKSPKNICKHLISDDNRIGFRIVGNEFCKFLLKLMKRPLVSTSANLHKEAFPKSFKEINKEILKQVDYVVDLPTENWNNKPSSILKINLDGNLFKIR